MPENETFRRVNPILGKKPKFGFIAADQFFPWVVILLVSYIAGKNILKLNWVNTGVIAAWGITTWWVLTAQNNYSLFSKLMRPPTYTKGFKRAIPLLPSSYFRNYHDST